MLKCAFKTSFRCVCFAASFRGSFRFGRVQKKFVPAKKTNEVDASKIPALPI